ncbi:MAG: hypothetical protein J5589_13245 [Firmicutes bacterium]|nr:hypothetical protein [Bacillota bacterium]
MKKIIALFLAVALCLGGCSMQKEKQGESTVGKKGEVINLAKAIYPEEIRFPSEDQYTDYTKFHEDYRKWVDAQKEKRENADLSESMDAYYAQALKAFLLSGKKGENIAVSPLNIYLALSLLAESTNGETRAQILDVLGRKNIEDVRRQAKILWESNYHDDGSVTSILANSVWLDEEFNAKKDWLDELVKEYYASIFSGQAGSEEMDQALQAWLNEQTGDRLKEAAESVKLSPETVFALVSTIYFKGRWDSEFNKNLTDDQFFHGTDGDVTVAMMHQSITDSYYFGDKFSAVQKYMTNAGQMIFILPDEGVTSEELLMDEQALAYMIRGEAENKYLIVNLSVPKFDLTSNLMLNETLKELGITDVFGKGADFSPTSDDEVILDAVQHAARVTVDEEGVTAAAFTVMLTCGAAMPPEEKVDFTLDRPFIFLLKSDDGQILFAGIVNQVR